MSPTIVLKDGKPIIAIGAAGGPRIISAVTLGLIRMLDLRQTPAEALAGPRIHQQWSPDELMVEATMSADLKHALAGRGHKLTEPGSMGVAQIVARTRDGKGFVELGRSARRRSSRRILRGRGFV